MKFAVLLSLGAVAPVNSACEDWCKKVCWGEECVSKRYADANPTGFPTTSYPTVDEPCVDLLLPSRDGRDTFEWDDGGAFGRCSSYAGSSNGWECGTGHGSTCCEAWGHRFTNRNGGLNANQACCACGGGSTAAPTETPTEAPTSICDQKAGQTDCGNICAYSNCPSFNSHKRSCEISTKPGEVGDPCTPTNEGQLGTQLAILELEIGEICGIVVLAVCIAALLIRYCQNTRSTSLTPAAVEGAALSNAQVLDGV
jgi:hypothetical protein